MSKQQNQMAVRFKSLLAENEADVKWERSLNTIFSPGSYAVEIDHTSENVGLPFGDCGEEHYIVGNLVVTDSGTIGPKQHNRLIGQTLTLTCRDGETTKIYTRTYGNGKWSEWRSLVENGTFDKISSTEELVATVESLSSSIVALTGEGEGSVTDIVNKAVVPIDKKSTENSSNIDKIIKGDVQVALAHDIYSLQGKNDNATFLKRTTAGNTTINSGTARLKQLGGNIVKNIVDGEAFKGFTVNGDGVKSFENGVLVFESSDAKGQGSVRWKVTPRSQELENHIYYQACALKCSTSPGEYKVFIGWGALSNDTIVQRVAWAENHTNWQWMSVVYTSLSSVNYHNNVIGDKRTSDWGSIYVKNYLHIDLTEMFGSGNEPSKEECDAIFSTMQALPQGVSVAQPVGFKSVGFNHCDSSKAMVGKSIVDGAITDGGEILVVMPCVPCKFGDGENNGYVIATGEGDIWTESTIKGVYYSPFNPLEYSGELYLDKLLPQACSRCNGVHNVYLPACAGYIIIETTTTDNLCAHLAWSGDIDYKQYEPYNEDSLQLPEITQMSEWGLAGILDYNDVIDFDSSVYKRCIKKIDLRTAEINLASSGLYAWKNDNGEIVYTETVTPGNSAAVHDVNTGAIGYTGAPADDNSYISFKNVTYYRYSDGDLSRQTFSIPLTDKMAHNNAYVSGFLRKNLRGYGSLKAADYNKALSAGDRGSDGKYSNLFFSFHEYKNVDSLRNWFVNNLTDKQAAIYYVSAEEIYPIDSTGTSTFLASDYGCEEIVGSSIPLGNNIIFYMRSLVSEVRNFIDRLYARFSTTDAKFVADRIYSTVKNVDDYFTLDSDEQL